MRLIWEKENYRIIEMPDNHVSLDDLKGNMFCSETNPDVSDLIEQEQDFERLVESEGVFGYTLQRWDPEVDQGWCQVDAVWGFVGSYKPELEAYNHYIVEELIKLSEKN